MMMTVKVVLFLSTDMMEDTTLWAREIGIQVSFYSSYSTVLKLILTDK